MVIRNIVQSGMLSIVKLSSLQLRPREFDAQSSQPSDFCHTLKKAGIELY